VPPAPRVTIRSFQERGIDGIDTDVVVAVDVIRATTTAITAVEAGMRCFPAQTLEEAHELKQRLGDCMLVGELGGSIPDGFDLTNSPATLAALDGGRRRPVVLLSSSGTRMIGEARAGHTVYVASLRNYSAQADALEGRDVTLIGAGSRGEFREEDQLCCAWIAERLVGSGHEADVETRELIGRWHGQPAEAIRMSESVSYVTRTGQLEDLDFILEHIDDVDSAFVLAADEIVRDERP
jgi:2-phosphosulfolactate phosphatase